MTLQTTNPRFLSHKWTRTKQRICSAKLRNGVSLQPEPHFKATDPNLPTTNINFRRQLEVLKLEIPDYEGPKSQLRNHNSRGKRTITNYEARGWTVCCVSLEIIIIIIIIIILIAIVIVVIITSLGILFSQGASQCDKDCWAVLAAVHAARNLEYRLVNAPAPWQH